MKDAAIGSATAMVLIRLMTRPRHARCAHCRQHHELVGACAHGGLCRVCLDALGALMDAARVDTLGRQ